MQNNEISFADKKYISGREYVGVNRIEGSLVVVKKTHPVGYQELVEVLDRNGNIRRGMVLDTSDTAVTVQIFEGTTGLDMPHTKVRFMGEPLKLGVSEKMLGRGHSERRRSRPRCRKRRGR